MQNFEQTGRAHAAADAHGGDAILGLAAPAFHAPGFVRLSYATSMKNVEEGVRRMAEWLPKLT